MIYLLIVFRSVFMGAIRRLTDHHHYEIICSGYMAPEYVFDGQFSHKSDVFSFGILILEIVTGRKSNSFSYSDIYSNLPGYVSDLFPYLISGSCLLRDCRLWADLWVDLGLGALD